MTPTASPQSVGALQPPMSAPGQLLERREGAMALFIDRKTEAQTGPRSFKPRTLPDPETDPWGGTGVLQPQ